jgi:hypothetical protein
MHDDWHVERAVAAIRSAAQSPGNPEVADALAAAIAKQQGRERVAARKRRQEEMEGEQRREEEVVITGLQAELVALRATDPGMSLLTAVEYITSDPGRRFAIYRLCSPGGGNIKTRGTGQDAPSLAKDLAFLERRARAEGCQVQEEG